jgi:putative nucleotidyltransferase with HDIG domain
MAPAAGALPLAGHGSRARSAPLVRGASTAGNARTAGREQPGERWSSGRVVRWYLPLVALVTASIVVLPAMLATMIVPAGDLVSMVISAGLAMVISFALASGEATVWKRWRGSRDYVFADLMLWGCVRRWWTERRLRDVRGSYEAAIEAGAPVRIELLEGLGRLLEARSAYTYGHCRRVARHTERIARAMHLPEAEIARIRTAAAVHDLGKIYTPREILDKSGSLTDEEFAIVKLHSADGADMLKSVRDPELAAIVRHHHERLDGGGYPDGLVGEQIPLGARIIAVADTFDAVTSNRPYRRAHSQKKGLEILANEAGSQLDERAVAAFLERYSARRSIAPLTFLTAVSARALIPLGFTSGSLGAGGTSLLQLAPALGAAGLLALSPAGGRHQQRAAIRHGSPPAHARFDRPAPAQLGGRARASNRASTTSGRSPVRHRASSKPHPIASTAPVGQRVRTQGSHPSQGANASKPTSPPPSNTSSPPRSAPSSPPPTSSSSSPPPSPTPPTKTPSTQEIPPKEPPKLPVEAPKLPVETPKLPVNPPVTVPTIPNVSVPTNPTSGVSVPAKP